MAAKNTGLGRGLEALFGDVEIQFEPMTDDEKKERESKRRIEDENSILFVDINNIKPNDKQPRKSFDREKLEELAESILAHGLIQPVVLIKEPGGKGYELVAGERRWRAARIAGIKEIPAIVRVLTEEQNLLLSIIENMQREDLNPIEEAEAVNKMMNTYQFTQEEVAKSLGKSRPYIANLVRLLKLQDEIKEMILTNQLSQGHARALISLPGKKQLIIAKKAVKDGLSVREVERLAGEDGPQKKRAKTITLNPEISRIENDLKEVLGTRVKIKEKGKKGILEIEYYSKEELERLIDLLKSLQ